MQNEIEKTLVAAVDAHHKGNIIGAHSLYTSILKISPTHPDANHNLGLIAANIGKQSEALPFFERALRSNSSVPQFWKSFIMALVLLGRKQEARDWWEKGKHSGISISLPDEIDFELDRLNVSISSDGDDGREAIGQKENILNSLTLEQAFRLVKKKMGEGSLSEAKQACSDILSKFSNNKRAKNLYAEMTSSAVRRLSEKDEPSYDILQTIIPCFNNGDYSKSLALSSDNLVEFPRSPTLYNIKGASLAGLKKYVDAIDCYKKATELKPDYMNAFFNMGASFQETGDLDAAHNSYLKALQIEPAHAASHNNLGIVLKKKGLTEAALRSYQRAIEINPDYPEAFNNLGNVHMDQGDWELAIEAYKKSVLVKPDYAEVYNNMGVALQGLGEFKSAISNYQKAISLDPRYTEAFRNLGTIKKYHFKDEYFLQMDHLYRDGNLDDELAYHLCFALAKASEELEELDTAFNYYLHGNALRRSLLKYDIYQDEKLFAGIKAKQKMIVTKVEREPMNLQSIQPIFIIGMPRSGTTLVEQILSSHTEVTGAGELPHFEAFGKAWVSGAVNLCDESLNSFTEHYLNHLSKVSQNKPYVIDKMPQNFRFVPLILATFPNAKIIHVKRSRKAILWSNFKQCFKENGLGYSYDLRDIINYLNLYEDLMATWHQLFPNTIHDIVYESLIADQYSETQALVDYLGLDFESELLSPHENKRRVLTASNQQVRQKIYKGSSEAWMKFRPFLKDIIGELVD
jgi:tetratricopeptide (TPR) repeat protein